MVSDHSLPSMTSPSPSSRSISIKELPSNSSMLKPPDSKGWSPTVPSGDPRQYSRPSPKLDSLVSLGDPAAQP